DRRAPAAGPDVLDQRAGAVEVALDVDLDGLVDGGVGGVDQRAEVRVGRGVVDQAVDPAEGLDSPGEQRVDLGRLAGVTGDGDRAIGGERGGDAVEVGL